MSRDWEVMTIKERYDHITHVLQSQRFLNKEGLGNEVPFFICPYKVEETDEVEGLLGNLKKLLKNTGINVLDINLYDLSIELLKERDIWDQVIASESEYEKDELLEIFSGVLDAEDYIVPAIAQRMEEGSYDILFITGVGAVFPYIRSSHLLENLQSTAKEKPTVLFFPGQYQFNLEKGAHLVLFNRMPNDRYYRAFNLFDYIV
ncbi:hypothetical protein DSLASN_30530 [Desulfoluna limicola]|uniref:Cytoplasmic protein n=1 Tax=Desulfoluna limicola TaxID=2810562 RepID=A0ABN6F623_9BACT|nr:DUF1788 domain-containing protein [Desulfoluna limicola]BCS97421.1 hypothetical protein DSLASN_30530 [Desulfoluna limicola]